MLLALLIALAISLYDYFWIGSGIDHTVGDLIVICAVAVLLCASAFVSFVRRMSYWLRLTLNLGILIGILGSAVAGYFLETSVILAFLAIALLAWAVHVAAHSAVGFPSTSGSGARA